MSTPTTHGAAGDPGQRDVILGFNPGPSPLPDKPVHESIRRQALRTPHALALRAEDSELTYAELLDRAALVAARLAADGAGPGTVVGLCAQRGADLVVAVLGILMSGAAYLPVDPRQPVRRSTAMLASARAALLLVDGPESPLADGCPLPVRALDGRRLPGGGAIPEAAPTPPDWRGAAGPDSFAGLACVVFTSGSTGEPKGVELTHLALANRLEGMLEAFRVGPDDVLLHKTPYTFDVSIWELLLAFMAGAALVVAPPDAHRDPQALVELITGHGVTMVHFVPSMLELFVSEPGFDKCVSLRTVLSGGEAASTEAINILMERLPGARAYNMYGPAEATIDVTAWPCRRPEPGAIPIGRPLSNVTAYVVDEQGGLAPIGTPGELLLGGACLARGYAGRPDLTGERFVEVDLAGRPERVYRTGDLVQWSAEGHLDYLGRIDTQVKIRGQRIELGEIEAALRRHPLVRNAVAVLRDKRSLIAYFVPTTPPAPSDAEAELRAHLRGLLPEHMVPARIVELAEIPVNAHGKADRGALPEPPRRRPRSVADR